MSTPPPPNKSLGEEIGKRQPFDLIEEEVFLNIARTSEALTGAFVMLFKAHGLSMSLYNALRIVVGEGADGARVSTITERMIFREPDTTRLVDKLEKAGYVERQRCSEDRRVVHVVGTALGKKMIKELKEQVYKLHKAQLGHLNKKQLGVLNDLVVEAREVVDSDEANSA